MSCCAHVGAHAVILHRANGMVRMLDSPMPPKPDVTFDLTKGNVPHLDPALVRDAVHAAATGSCG